MGVVLILEGMPYVAFPESMRGWLKKVSEMKPESLRLLGLLSMSSGLVIVWFVQRSGFFQ